MIVEEILKESATSTLYILFIFNKRKRSNSIVKCIMYFTIVHTQMMTRRSIISVSVAVVMRKHKQAKLTKGKLSVLRNDVQVNTH